MGLVLFCLGARHRGSALSKAHESQWLATLRKPVRILMVASVVATAILILWENLGRMYSVFPQSGK